MKIRSVISSAALALIASTSFALDLNQKVDFNIPAQDLSAALIQFSQQTRLQIIVADDLTGQSTQGIKGQHAIKQALSQLLGPAGLRYQVASDTAITVGKTETKTTAREVKTLRLAQADTQSQSTQPSPSQGEGKGEDQKQGEGRGEDSKETISEVVVTGTHIRGANPTSQVTVLDRDYIDSTGISTTSRLIESLPQNFALASQSGVLVDGVSASFGQGSAINLRGIGEGTTLTLLNGHRLAPGFYGRAVDISALPISVIERVEVLTDGASALYGSDAVGGVVNFILRRDFEGAETALRYGYADGDVNEYHAAQTFGSSWTSGNALVAFDYYYRDLLRADQRDFVPPAADVGSLFPEDENVSAFLSGRQRVGADIELFGDLLYTDRNSYNEGGQATDNTQRRFDNQQLVSTIGLDWRLPSGWQLTASGSYARNESDLQEQADSIVIFAGARSGFTNTDFSLWSAELIANGPLFNMPGGSARGAVGAAWRSETMETVLTLEQLNGSIVSRGTGIDSDQTVSSVFGEVLFPLVGPNNALPAIQSLEISIAGRFDDYNTFGSSFDPKLGLMWEPVPSLRIRGSYGTSYVAPSLSELDLSSNLGRASFGRDTGTPGTPTAYILGLAGTDVESLGPQTSENFYFGLEFMPRSVQGLRGAVGYYDIRYDDKIESLPPSSSVMLTNPAAYGSLIIRDPTVQQVQQAIAIAQQGPGGFIARDASFAPIPLASFDPNMVDIIVDRRRRNLAVVNTNGIDFSLSYAFPGLSGTFTASVAGTHILELQRQVSATSAAVENVDTFWNPPDWRARAGFGWEGGALSAHLFVNYSDSYTDNRTTQTLTVDSQATADIRLAYEFGDSSQHGLTVAFSVQNLFDRDPPRTALLDFRDIGFDPTNANPMGRLIAVELVKSW